MKLLNNIKSKIQNIITVTSSDKVHWIDIDKIRIDPELKGIFVQKESDIQNISLYSSPLRRTEVKQKHSHIP